MSESIVIPRYNLLSKDCSLFKSPIKSKAKSFYRNDKLPVLKITKKVEPAKLESVYSELVLNVISETIKKSEIIAALPYIYENLEKYKIAFGTELTELLIHHKQLENAFNQTNSAAIDENAQKDLKAGSVNEIRRLSRLSSLQRSNSEMSLPLMSSASPMSEDGQTDFHYSETAFTDRVPFSSGTYTINKVSVDQEYLETRPRTSSASRQGRRQLLPLKEGKVTENDVIYSSKIVVKSFLSNPAAYQAVMSDKMYQPSDEELKVVNYFKNEQKEIEKKLNMTPDEIAMQKHEARLIAEESEFQQATVHRVNAQMVALQEEKQAEIDKLDEKIVEMQATIDNMRLMSEDSLHRLQHNGEKQGLMDQKNSDGKMTKLKAEMEEARKEYDDQLARDWEEESELRAKNSQIENEIESIIQSYDKEMGERQDEFDEIELLYAQEKQQLIDLMERFEVVKTEYLAIMEERRLIREAREAAERELQMCIRAAASIQAIWRAYKVRKAVKARKRRSGRGVKKVPRRSVAQ